MASAIFKDNVILITGASQGIGKELALQLSSQGARLALSARHAETLEAVAEECRARGGQAVVIPADIRDVAQCQQLVEQTVAHYGRLDTLVNNAGLGFPKRFANLPNLDTMRNEIDLNYFGTVACTYYALPYLRQTKGRIMGVNSFGGLIGFPGTIGYNASKHAMRGFLNTLRVELRGTGVTTSVAYLGAIRTDRLTEVMGADKVRTIPTMAPDVCARLIIRQLARRQRDQVMTASGKLVTWLSKWAPGLVDRIIVNINAMSYED
jgi:short-subunit dehydrogenase